ncbi:MAG: hypothetical protein ABIP34_07435 [Rhodoferax sp.]|uniref:hypothetical protein n=1 Tax=Rhodoferax sp. TaxID=50421 RepID=UPI0032636EAF
MPPAPHPDSLQALCAAEQAAVLARRQHVLAQPPVSGAVGPADTSDLDLPRVGLALSGGGVRSATFALGLMRGLAQNRCGSGSVSRGLARDGLLGRLDYLSTVSGGGYIGAMWGRLVDTYGIQAAQKLMADGASPVLAWLRRNGRYLNPSGSRDTGTAVATYLRAWLAIHTELMFTCFALGLLVLAPHLLQHRLQWLTGWAAWHTPWWVLSLVVALALVPGLIAGYWAARDAGGDKALVTHHLGLRDAVFVLVAGLCTALLWGSVAAAGLGTSVAQGPGWLNACALGMGSLTLGQAGVVLWLWRSRNASHSLLVAKIRHLLTSALRGALLLALALLALGLLDLLSWWLLEAWLEALDDRRDGNPSWLWGGLGVGGFVLLVLRNLVQPLQQMAAETSKQKQNWVPRLVNSASLLACVLLGLGWLVLVQWFVFALNPFGVFVDVPAVLRAGLLLAAWTTWMVLTAANAQMANSSSLHSFYRARLVRAYLAAGNKNRHMDDPGKPRSDVTQVVEGDDMHMQSYAPERKGGPIHLVNTCLNQTRDYRSGLYNADRKGAAITASWRGFEVGPDNFIAQKKGQDVGTLGRWVAVSGAAASPGAGAYTSRGLALLLYLLGVRLGHWMRAPTKSPDLKLASWFGWRWCPKPMMLFNEALATFYGVERPWWYLSDGGHFENTGVYALLKRELDFIILSDASCDPDYEFGDLENMVRKARIDFGAEIDFYSHTEAARVLTRLFTQERREVTVLSPEDMPDNHSCRGVMLARIRYRPRPGAGGAEFRPEGTLLVVKPNLHDALDVDLLAYKQKHPGFPHESTADQSFDEAQWESYHRLGEDFGRAMTDEWLALLPGWRSPAHHGMQVAARLGGEKTGDAKPSEPLWRRGVRATAIGTTLGLGASGTLIVSLWQVQDQLQRKSNDLQTDTSQLYAKVSEKLDTLEDACPKLPQHMLTQTEDLLGRRDSPAMRRVDASGVERLVEQITGQCAKLENYFVCSNAIQQRVQDLCSLVKKPAILSSAMGYWVNGASPDDQARAGKKLQDALGQKWDALGVMALFQLSVAPPSVDSTYPPPPVVQPPPVVVPVDPSVPDTKAQAVAQACTGKTTLYIQVYDPASFAAANVLRDTLNLQVSAAVQVAPVENVVRSADLRQQRRPEPWPKPTFVLHDRSNPGVAATPTGSQACAKALSQYLGPPWVLPGAPDQVWIRNLPDVLKATPGVIELWLPSVASKNAERTMDYANSPLAMAMVGE